MGNQVYISYVVQGDEVHTHHSEIVEIPSPQISIYSDNVSKNVIEWVNAKQREMPDHEKIVIMNFFSISNYK